MFDAATGLPLFVRTEYKDEELVSKYKLGRTIPFMELVGEYNRRELVKKTFII